MLTFSHFYLSKFSQILEYLKTGAVLIPNNICFEILKMLAFHGFTVQLEHYFSLGNTYQLIN